MISTLLLPGLVLAVAMTSLTSSASGVGGGDFPGNVTLANRELVLNGTATRTMFGVRVYQVGLYVSRATREEAEIMERNHDPKRLQIVLLRQVPKAKFASALRENIDRNFSAFDREKFSQELAGFLGCFEAGADLKAGEVVAIDYLPAEGTAVMLDGRRLGIISGDAFYHALLRLWIGNPLQASIKIGLLGGEQSR